MSHIINRFDVCDDISESLRNQIKLIHVFDTKDVLFVTVDDRVFGFGRNEDGVLGFGHSRRVLIYREKYKPIEISQLRDKKVKEFHKGEDFVVALTRDNKVYAWGCNNCGQLGRDEFSEDFEYHKPSLIKSQFTSRIVQISVGSQHALVLTSDGQVWGWGSNENGQLAHPEQNSFVSRIQIFGLNGLTVKSIHSFFKASFVLTSEGMAYSWGEEDETVLGRIANSDDHYLPSLCISEEVIDICADEYKTYFLTKEGKIYFFVYRNEVLVSEMMDHSVVTDKDNGKRRRIENKFIGIKAIGNLTAITDQLVYELEDNKLIATDYKTFEDYYNQVKQLTVNTLAVEQKNRQNVWMRRVFNDPSNCDIKFKVKRRNGQTFDYIYCHKLIISGLSDHFKAMFDNDWAESRSNEIEIKDFSFESYFEYIQWLYSDVIDTKDPEVLLEMLSLSDHYLDNDFKECCIKKLKSVSNVQNLCLVYSQAILHNYAKPLEVFCFRKIVENMKKIVSSDEYKKLEPKVGKKLFETFATNFKARLDFEKMF